MEGRRRNKYEGELEETVVAKDAQPSYNIHRTVKLVLMISARVKLYSPHSGKLYVWPRSGTVVEVDEQDAEGFLKKQLGTKPCCGGRPNYLFSRVE